MNVGFFSTDFRKILNIKFHENSSSGSRVVPCGRTDRHTEADSRFPQFLRNRLKIAYEWNSEISLEIRAPLVRRDHNNQQVNKQEFCFIQTRPVAYRGGGGVQNLPEIPKALQNRAKLNPVVKTLKNCWI